jgi:hypothetical protein
VGGWSEWAVTGLVGIETEGLAEQLEHSRYDAGNDVFDFVIRKHGQKLNAESRLGIVKEKCRKLTINTNMFIGCAGVRLRNNSFCVTKTGGWGP